MNLQHDFRYVTPGDVESFGGWKKRNEAFGEKGWIGKWMRGLDMVGLVDGTLFMHGGLKDSWSTLGVEGLNKRAREAINNQRWHDGVLGGDGPLWHRNYAMGPKEWGPGGVCEELDRVLEKTGAKRMVLGHTPQMSGQILTRCNGKVFVIDVGISSYYGSNCAALEIVGDKVTGLYCPKSTKAAEQAVRVDLSPDPAKERSSKKGKEKKKSKNGKKAGGKGTMGKIQVASETEERQRKGNASEL
ncbi:hypothetical protein HDV05_007313 [Chytridiales sp. JEL 0842]|nr:hypothetical protein HDV05_007313 [Chytridiales sp. JEL 0842]